MRFVKLVGKGINRYDMIRPGDRVLVGVSGGKDSLSVALALSLRLRWLPVSYSIEALSIDWEEYPLTQEQLEDLAEFFDAIEVPLRIERARMMPDSFGGTFSCYHCSRNRKRILFERMRAQGIRKLVLGHHMDDIIETTLMNLIYHGSFATMMPVQEFFDGGLTLVRPMCLVKEQMVKNTAEFLEFPLVKPECPFHETNIRAQLKPLIRQMVHLNKQARENLYRAPENINWEYLPNSLR
jgi:tRNA 2-thiocytidine biosynthesis protein TtcA